jgi:hypothetical protein
MTHPQKRIENLAMLKTTQQLELRRGGGTQNYGGTSITPSYGVMNLNNAASGSIQARTAAQLPLAARVEDARNCRAALDYGLRTPAVVSNDGVERRDGYHTANKRVVTRPDWWNNRV